MNEPSMHPPGVPRRGWLIGVIAFVVLAGTALALWAWLGLPPFAPPLDIDLVGGVVLVYEVEEEDAEFDMDQLIDGIRRRVDPDGARQATVRAAGRRQVEVILPGIDKVDLEDIKRRMASLGTLEFRILAHTRADRPGNIEGWMRKAVNLPADEKQVDNAEGEPVVFWVPLDEKAVEHYYDNPTGDEEIVNTDKTAFVNAKGFATRRIPTGKDQPDRVEILVIKDPFDVDGRYLKRVAPNIDPAGYVVDFFFNAEGARRFSALTARYQPVGDFQYHLGIILDGRVTSAPAIRSVIASAGQITGYHGPDGKKERDEVIAILKAGALPARLTLQSETRVAPVVGR